MSRKVRGNTKVARDNAMMAVKQSAESKRAAEFMQAAIKALADAIEALDDRMDRLEQEP
jgi:ubiquinone biosynthesis protein UbiJ